MDREAPGIDAAGHLLIVDDDLSGDGYASALRSTYRIASASDFDAARRWLLQSPVDLLVTGATLSGGSGADLCRMAKSCSVPASVLVTTPEPSDAPEAIIAGCDGVLLKPFAPNLLYARIGRLMRARMKSDALCTRSNERRERLGTTRSKLRHIAERQELWHERTIVEWPNTQCPYCDHAGVAVFDYASTRRAWYACLDCKRVWIAKRQE